MTRTIVCLAGVFLLLVGTGYPSRLVPTAAYAEEAWKAEFDDICMKTSEVMTLSKEDLKGLVERCDRLKPQIEKLDESAAKVYQVRLKKCRDLFVFVLETPK